VDVVAVDGATNSVRSAGLGNDEAASRIVARGPGEFNLCPPLKWLV
jgi:hypothetical protein